MQLLAPCMQRYYLLGSKGCSATYIQEANRDGQDIQPNVKFVETDIRDVSVDAPHTLIQVCV
jgi:hypothetical protein